MVKGLVDKEHMIDIGKAIREKNGETATYYPVNMASKIRALNGTADYEQLENLPSINRTLLKGELSLEDLGIQEILESGINIKTINKQSILGKGNIDVSGGGGGSQVQADWTETDREAPSFIQHKPDIEELLSAKVDKVSGKGLSTNDYTNVDKNNLKAIGDYINDDLPDLLDEKQNILNPGVNIKGDGGTTVVKKNGVIVISSDGGGGGGEGGTSDYERLQNLPIINDIQLIGSMTSKDLKLQDTLKSGENIATINGNDLLQGGNIVIKGGEGGVSSYSDLTDKPIINGYVLDGDVSSSDLGLVNQTDFDDLSVWVVDELKYKQAILNPGRNIKGTGNTSVTKDEDGVIVINSTGGGSGGVSSYSDLTDKPKINGSELNGSMSSVSLGLASHRDFVDAMEKINDKQDLLKPGVNIKGDGSTTVIEKEGVITIYSEGGGGGEGGTSNYENLQNLPLINSKQLIGNMNSKILGLQDTLKSGENIATINGETLLEGKDITIESGTSNYSKLSNLPQINGVPLIENRSGTELKLVDQAKLEMYLKNKQDILNPGVNIIGEGNTTIRKSDYGTIIISSTGGGGGEGGTSDYEQLINLPSINSKTVKGDLTLNDLRIQEKLEPNTNIFGMGLSKVIKGGDGAIYIDTKLNSTSQSDWEQYDETQPDYIKNKPDLTEKQDLLNPGVNIKGEGNTTVTKKGSAIVISSTGGGGGSQVQADWKQNDETQPDYIKNKPDVRTKTQMIGDDEIELMDRTGGFSTQNELNNNILDVANTKQDKLIVDGNDPNLIGRGTTKISKDEYGNIIINSEEQAQADWKQDNPKRLSYILNKPDLTVFATTEYVDENFYDCDEVDQIVNQVILLTTSKQDDLQPGVNIKGTGGTTITRKEGIITIHSEEGGGGEGGTSDYEKLQNIPLINKKQLIGNKTSEDLGLQDTLIPNSNIIGEGGTRVTRDETGLIIISSEGGGGGTSDYTKLSNLPTINGKVVKGSLTLDTLGIQEILVPNGNIVGEGGIEITRDETGLIVISSNGGGGGEGGTSDYEQLTHLPTINGKVVKGSLTLDTLGIQEELVPNSNIIGEGGTQVTRDETGLIIISSEGEKNVQADWEQDDNKQPDYIKNKPDLNEYTTKTFIDLNYYPKQGIDILLEEKQNVLNPGDNIKGEGNTTVTKKNGAIVISSTGGGGEGGVTSYSDLTDKPKINGSELNGSMSSKDLKLQDTLQSGKNIATINGNDLLQGGDITIQGGSGETFTKLFANDNMEVWHSQSYVNIIIKGKHSFETAKEWETFYTFTDDTCLPPSNIVTDITNPFANSVHAYCMVNTSGAVNLGCVVTSTDTNIYGNIFYHKRFDISPEPKPIPTESAYWDSTHPDVTIKDV